MIKVGSRCAAIRGDLRRRLGRFRGCHDVTGMLIVDEYSPISRDGRGCRCLATFGSTADRKFTMTNQKLSRPCRLRVATQAN